MPVRRDEDRFRQVVSASVHPATKKRLAEIAAGTGMKPGRVAGELLDELVPTVESVRQRLQIVRKGDSR